MSINSTLNIGTFNVFNWVNELPINFVPVLSFIFLPTDKRVKHDNVDGEDSFLFKYVSDVDSIKKRFETLNFTIKEIDNTISEITELPLEKTKLIAYYLFFQRYLLEVPRLKDNFNKNFIDYLTVFEGEDFKNDFVLLVYDLEGYKLEEVDNYSFENESCLLKFQHHELGNYLILREICIFLEMSDNDDLIILNLNSAQLFGIETPESLDDLSLILDVYNSHVEVKQKYLEMAKIHFTEHRFDLVYVELFIAVEAALNSYEKKKYLKLSADSEDRKGLNSILKGVSFLDRIRILVVFIGQSKLDGGLVKRCDGTPNRSRAAGHDCAVAF